MGSEKVIPIFGKGGVMRLAMDHSDGFFNRVTGLGTSRDKQAFSRFQANRKLTHEELENLYSDDDMASRVCDVVPEEELRQGYTIVVEPNDGETGNTAPEDAAKIGIDVKEKADTLGLQKKLIDARTWGRVFGGGALLLGADDGALAAGQMAKPLNVDAIKSFDFINVLDRRFLQPVTFYTDPMEAKLGLPRTYLITPQVASSIITPTSFDGAVEVHETRLVTFGGVRTTIQRKQNNGGWEDPLLQRMQNILTQHGTSFDTLSHLIQDSNQGVFKMEGLIEALASNESDLVMKRLQMMDMARSSVRSVILDAETEDFERQNFTWSGIKDPFELLLLRLASAARMPVTVLMGQSPSGMNATGESDMRWFYDTIQSSRENIIQPALEYILKLIMLSQDGPTSGVEPDSWTIKFPSLWQPTPSEIAKIELEHAQADSIYEQMGAANADEIATSRFSEGGFERPLQVNLEERRAAMSATTLEGDIANTPTLGDGEGTGSVSQTALVGGQSSALIDLAKAVQGGELDRDSAIAIVLVSHPQLSPEQAAEVVGDIDPEKVAQREKATAALAAAPVPEPGRPPAGDPEAQLDAKHVETEEEKKKRLKREREGRS